MATESVSGRWPRGRRRESDHGRCRRTGPDHQDSAVSPVVEQGRIGARGGVPGGANALTAPAGDIAADVRAMIEAARDVFTCLDLDADLVDQTTAIVVRGVVAYPGEL